MSVLWEAVLVMSLLEKKKKKNKKKKHGSTLPCELTRHDHAWVDLLYTVAPGETGFVAEASVWNVAQTKVSQPWRRCRKKALIASLNVWTLQFHFQDGDDFSGELLAGIRHLEAQ